MNNTAIGHTRWFCGALSLALFLLSSFWTQAADVYRLCGIDQKLFSKFAYPAGVPYLSDRLIKWNESPGLFILSPSKDFEEENKGLFDHIRKDELLTDAPMKFVHYASPSEIYDVVTQYGINNIFIFVDPAGFTNDPKPIELRQAVMDVLLSPQIVERLFSTALKDQQFSLQSHINVASGEVYASVALINPAISPKAMPSTLYTLYYAALSPPATYRTRDFFNTMFVPTATDGTTHLSEFAKAYYGVVLDPSVPTGALPDQFGECDG